jgi:hypothetical protein
MRSVASRWMRGVFLPQDQFQRGNPDHYDMVRAYDELAKALEAQDLMCEKVWNTLALFCCPKGGTSL